jgi:hypothetical protein
MQLSGCIHEKRGPRRKKNAAVERCEVMRVPSQGRELKCVALRSAPYPRIFEGMIPHARNTNVTRHS